MRFLIENGADVNLPADVCIGYTWIHDNFFSCTLLMTIANSGLS